MSFKSGDDFDMSEIWDSYRNAAEEILLKKHQPEHRVAGVGKGADCDISAEVPGCNPRVDPDKPPARPSSLPPASEDAPQK